MALVAILLLGVRKGRYRNAKRVVLFSSITETLSTITSSKVANNAHMRPF
ncbi:hypothetical protein [Oceanisphaera sp. IT1-181]